MGIHGKNESMEGVSKVRKRGCSSLSSILKNHRTLKRAILIGKRGGSSTPVPAWKMNSGSFPLMNNFITSSTHRKPKQVLISARKLGATLWEMNEIPVIQVREEKEEETTSDTRTKRGKSSKSHLSDLPHTPSSKGSQRSGSLRRNLGSANQKDRVVHERNAGWSDAGLMEAETLFRGLTPSRSLLELKNRFKEINGCPATEKELLKLLNRIWDLEEQHSSSMALVSALRGELKRARLQLDLLAEGRRSDRIKIDYMRKCFAEEKASWKSREKEKVASVFQGVIGELEVERKLRRKLEVTNKKLNIELAETRTLLAQAMKEVESERKVRQVMEEVCDELARNVGDDKAKVEELKKESEKAWEEVEKEREMLQMADVWREERVQMKLTDAKYQLEEKNAALDKLRNELEEFLVNKETSKEDGITLKPTSEELEQKEARLQQPSLVIERNNLSEGESNDDDDEDEDDSADSDLHSIELNRDENRRSFKWNCRSEENCRKLVADDLAELNGDLSPLIKELSDGFVWDLDSEAVNGFENITLQSDSIKQAMKQHCGFEIKRYNHVKNVNDQVKNGSRIACTSPMRRWNRKWVGVELGSIVNGRSKTEGVAKAVSETCLKSRRIVEAKGCVNGQIAE